jgi:hypothetical protein
VRNTIRRKISSSAIGEDHDRHERTGESIPIALTIACSTIG